MWRHYYRCRDCLTTMVVDEFLVWDDTRCGACSGRLLYIGAVTDDATRWYKVEELPPCDHRCVSATGPKCECQCGGENHGTGLLVQVLRDGGRVALVPNDPDAARGRAEEYRAARRAVWEAAHQRFGADYEASARGQYIRSRAVWEQLEAIKREVARIDSLATHANRLRRLEELRRRILEPVLEGSR